MALDLSKLNFFNRLNARARVFVLLGGVIGVIFLIYIGTRYFSSGNNSTIGPSHVASAPKNLQSVPGGSLTADIPKHCSKPIPKPPNRRKCQAAVLFQH